VARGQWQLQQVNTDARYLRWMIHNIAIYIHLPCNCFCNPTPPFLCFDMFVITWRLCLVVMLWLIISFHCIYALILSNSCQHRGLPGQEQRMQHRNFFVCSNGTTPMLLRIRVLWKEFGSLTFMLHVYLSSPLPVMHFDCTRTLREHLKQQSALRFTTLKT
jgi:hypothetical protein